MTDQQSPPPSSRDPPRSRWIAFKQTLRRHVYFVGPGIVAAVAYADPGNWATDLQAGSQYGYSLLFIVLLTGFFAVFIQVLACRLGIVSGNDLARQCRMLILKEDRNGNALDHLQPVSHLKWRKWALLYPLYAINEGAIIATELAELTGSAIALNLLFPGLPLWAGILVTSVDVVLILFLYRPPPNASFRILEAFIAFLIFVVLSCFVVLLVRTQPLWPQVFLGYLPSHHVVDKGALYVSVGILGATVMPHAIILGSHFASIDRLPVDSIETSDSKSSAADDERIDSSPSGNRWTLFSHAISRLFVSNSIPSDQRGKLGGRVGRLISMFRPDPESQSAPPELPPRSLRNIRLHIKHASFDIAMSLVSFAIVINSAILIVSATVFYYQSGRQGDLIVAGLYDAFYLLKAQLGSLAAILFAIGLLASAQSASITVTLAGQLVSEGFINWKTDPFLRRVITRLVAVIPSLAVSIAVGKDGLDEMLVASQVALSIALPFVMLPLIIVTGRKSIMVSEQPDPASDSDTDSQSAHAQTDSAQQLPPSESVDSIPIQVLNDPSEPGGSSTPRYDSKLAHTSTSETNQKTKDGTTSAESTPVSATERKKQYFFTSPWPVQVIAYAIFGVIVIADVYVLYTTFSGQD